MRSPKLLLPWNGRTLIEHVLSNWRASRVDQVIVVVHPDDEELAAKCAGVHVVRRNPPPAEMKDSIGYGLEAAADKFAAGPGDVWLVAPADMPNLSPAAIDMLLAASAAEVAGGDKSGAVKSGGGAPRILAAARQGRRGHPVLFPWSLAPEVHALADDEGLNILTRRHEVVEVEVGDAAQFDDVDTPEDYAKLRPRP